MAGATSVDVLTRVALHNLAARIGARVSDGDAPKMGKPSREIANVSLAVVSASVAASETGSVPKNMWAEAVVGMFRVAVSSGWDPSELGELINREIENGCN